MFDVYIIRNQNGKYYVGFTADIEKRIKVHNKNSSQFTKFKGPWELIYSESFQDKKSAWLREREIKKYKGGNAFKKLIGELF